MNAPLLQVLARPEVDGTHLITTEYAEKRIALYGTQTVDGCEISGVFLAHMDITEQNNLIDWFTSAQLSQFEDECDAKLMSLAEADAWERAERQRDADIDRFCGFH